MKKEPQARNILENEETLKRKSIDDLKEIAKLRGIKNRSKLKKEGLITNLLRSESSNAEHNYMKSFNNNTNVGNNTNFGNNYVPNDGTYDGKIRDKISDIGIILSRLGNTIANKDKKKIKKGLYEIEKNKIFQIRK